MMETLWEELSRADDELESPDWHGAALAETVQRLAEEKEQVLEWSEAKAELRLSARVVVPRFSP